MSRLTARLTPFLIACLLATWLIWGSTYLAIKLALPSLPPFLQMGSRFVVAGGLLLACVAARGGTLPGRRDWWHAAIVGTLMIGGGMGGTAYAEQSVGSGLVVVFIAVIPVLVAVLAALDGVHPTRRQALGIVVALVGVVLLTRGAGFRASPVGLTAIAIACVTWSIGSNLTQRRLPLAPGAAGYASQMLAGGAFLLSLGAATGEWPRLVASWPLPPVAVGAWLYLVGAGSLLGFTAYMALLQRVPPLLASSYCYVNPVIALLLGMLFAGEVVTATEWCAVGLVLVGVVLLLVATFPRAAASER